jgi:hypothetical protein
MAAARRIPSVVADYAVFLALLALRFALDVARFPVDGYARVTPLAVIETQVFYVSLHYGVYLLLRANRVPVAPASRVALVLMGTYLFLHLFEYWFYAGGRAPVYAPAEHLWENLLSGFMSTGDAGFWQVMRIFVCGALLLLYLAHRRTAWSRVLLTLPFLYLWGMLLAHPHAWLPLPEPATDEPSPVAELGVRGFLICGWYLLAVCLAALAERSWSRPAAPGSWRFSGAWAAGFFVLLFWQPMITGGTSAMGLLLIQCGLIAHLALIAPRPEAVGAVTSGDLVRLMAVALVGAILVALWGLIGLLGLGLVAWLVLERRVVRVPRRRTARMGLVLGAGLGVLWIALSLLQPVLIPETSQPSAASLADAGDRIDLLTGGSHVGTR